MDDDDDDDDGESWSAFYDEEKVGGAALSTSPPSSDDTTITNNGGSTTVPTAKYVKGNVGMAKGRFKKRYRRGKLVIKLNDGGSLTFYRTLKSERRGVKNHHVAPQILEDVPHSPGRSGVRKGRVTVLASMESFHEKLEDEVYLYIPENVPWRFQASGSMQFRIVVPYHQGKVDRRVVIEKHGLSKFLDGNSNQSNMSNMSNDNMNMDDSSAYTSKNCQIFEFKCATGELAVYARAAETLRRNLTKMSAGYDGGILPTRRAAANMRIRTADGEHIAAQASNIFRTESIKTVTNNLKSSHGEIEFRCFPLYCYPNTWFTKADLSVELPRTSKKFHDLREDTPNEIGSLSVEVIQCIGLPNMDSVGLTDAVVYVVCESCAFVTDVIPNNCNPCWLPLSRRACIFPICHGYSQLFVGVFDYDGEGASDDFIGRLVIDIPQLQSKSGLIDITLPLRDSSRVYNKKKLGSVRLRLQLNWKELGERAALISYLPQNVSTISERMKAPESNPVVVACPDSKSFQNIVCTVYGKDIPGKYKTHTKIALDREIKLIKKMTVNKMKEILMNTVRWENPLFSVYVFSCYMYCVIKNSISLVPAFIVSFIFIFMLNNYVKQNINSTSAKTFGYRSIGSLLVLLFTDKDVKKQRSRNSIIDSVLIWIFGMPTKSLDSWKYEDGAEFPFSSGASDPKRTSDEVAGRRIWVAAKEEERHHDISNLGSYEDDEEEEDDDMISLDDLSDDEQRDAGSDDESVEQDTKGRVRLIPRLKQHTKRGLPQDRRKSSISSAAHQRQSMLPNQNVSVQVASTITMKQQLKKWHRKAQTSSLHLFDDRVFIADDRIEAKKLLRMNNTKNPVSKKINPLLAIIIKIFECEVNTFRAFYNIAMWNDPMLSFWALLMIFCLMIILFFFPWRVFFFLVGILGLGPQNYFPQTRIMDWFGRKSMTANRRLTFFANPRPHTKRRTLHSLLRKGTNESDALDSIEGYGTLLNSPLLMRNNTLYKPDDERREVIVPSVPFRYNRFYDWPPDPNTVKVRRQSLMGRSRTTKRLSET